MKPKVIKKWLNRIVTLILSIIFLIMLYAVIMSMTSEGSPNFFGYQLLTVQSGSMEPAIKTGSIIAVKPGGDLARFKKGDVITFQTTEGLVVTHRIVETFKSGNQVSYKTKGDNNHTPDLNLVPSQNVLAEYKHFTIPYIGYIAAFSKSKNGIAVILFLSGFILFVGSIMFIWDTLTKFFSNQINHDSRTEDKQIKENGIKNKNFSLPKKLF